MRVCRNFWLLFFVILVLKIFFAYLIPLSHDESYYWVWSLHPQLSYFDHPPMVAWLNWLGNALFPLGSAIRWPAVIVGHLTVGIWCFILRDFFSVPLNKMIGFLFLMTLSPLFGLGSLVVTPDIPVMFFWSFGVYFFFRSLQTRQLLDYLAFGSCLGLGLLSKYHIVLLPITILLFLGFTRQLRSLRPLGVFVAACAGFAFSLPVLIWNYQNAWASFLFQINHGLGKKLYSPDWTISYLLGETLLFFPPLLWVAFKAGSPSTEQKALHWLAWGPLLFFFFSSFRSPVELNWPIIAGPSVFALAYLNGKHYPKLLKSAYIYFTIILVVIVSLIWKPWLPAIEEKIAEVRWSQDLNSLPFEYAPLYGGNYQLASWIWFHTQVPTYKLRGMSRYDFFDTLDESRPKSGPFYVVAKENTPFPQWVGDESFSVELIKALPGGLLLFKVHSP